MNVSTRTVPLSSEASRRNHGEIRWLSTAAERLGQPDVPLYLTLFLSMLATSSAWYVRVPVVTIAITAVLLPPTLHRPELWFALSAVLGANVVGHRWQVDNHQYLIVYWCLVVGLSASSSDPDGVRRRAARILVGLVFLLATAWKLLAPDFLDGSFFTYTLLTDPRFDEIVALAGGLDAGDLAFNRHGLALLHDPSQPLVSVELRSADRLAGAGRVLAWATVVLEGAIAVCFLVPGRRTARWRDPLLVLFALATYSVAPVLGFGWILLILGMAQRDRSRHPSLPLLYFGAFLAVLGFTSPWADIIGIAS